MECLLLNAKRLLQCRLPYQDLPCGMSCQRTLEQSVILVFLSANLNHFILSMLSSYLIFMQSTSTSHGNRHLHSVLNVWNWYTGIFIEFCMYSAIVCILFVKLCPLQILIIVNF